MIRYAWIFIALAGCGAPVIVVHQAPVAPITVQPAPPAVVPLGDDTEALLAMVAAGGVIQLDGRTYRITQSLEPLSGTTINGTTGTVIEFLSPPVGTKRQWCKNDRVIGISCHPYKTAQLPIAAGIEAGATEFTAARESDAATLQTGDWVIVTVNDPGIADAGTHKGYPTYIDWMQVDYVDGATVHTVQPFRMAFPNSLPFIANDSGLGFVRVTDDINNVTISNLTIKVDPGTHVAGVYAFATRGATLDHVTVIDLNADPVYTEESKGLTLTDCNLQGGTVLNEFAESVDLTITGSTFASDSVAVGLDLGTAFVTFSGNTIASANHVALYALYHVHDVSITDNTIGGIAGSDQVGILVWGSPAVYIADNTISGPGSVGIQASPDGHAALPETSINDIATGNVITGFTTPISMH